MRLVSFSVQGLFGTFDHEIKFDTRERIKIVHGPNGFGKTSVLRLIDAFFNSKYLTLRRIPYSKILFTFGDKSTIEVQRIVPPEEPKTKGIRRPIYATLTFTHRTVRASEESFTLKPPKLDRMSIPLSAIDDMVPTLARSGPEEWVHMPTDRELSLADVLEEFADQLPQLGERQHAEPDWMKNAIKSMPVYLIESQRLLLPTARGVKSPRIHSLPSPGGMSSAVSVYSKGMVDRIRETLAKSAEVSQSLDSSFPKRLLQDPQNGDTMVDDIRERYAAQVEKRTRLMEAGLLDREEEFPLPETSIKDSDKHVLALYVKDVESKLAAFDDILKKMELFKQMINGRFQYKQLKIDKSKGFIFNTLQGKNIPSSELSSGEQHEVVLANQLLFDVQEGSLILIDEPELSLHVAWQQEFLSDLKKITDVIPMDFLVATHSPQIIGGRWDLTVELKGPEQ
jgi:predicted ATP-binding protein involved in virulence